MTSKFFVVDTVHWYTHCSGDFKQKISETLYIKELRPELNIQKDSYSLQLLNKNLIFVLTIL